MASNKVLMTSEDMARALARVAHEIIERNRDIEDIVLVGMRTRGVPLAQRIGSAIWRFEGVLVPIGALDIGLYRDDAPVLGARRSVQDTDVPTDITDRHVVLVDDVLYTGRSIRAAMDALMDLGRPSSIQLAVLIDRGHRELPIRADYAGKNIPSSRDEEVRVQVQEVDGVDRVTIVSCPAVRTLRRTQGVG